MRAALQSLEAEGLVARGQRGLFTVAAVSADEPRQIYEVRFAVHATVTVFQQINRLLQEQRVDSR